MNAKPTQHTFSKPISTLRTGLRQATRELDPDTRAKIQDSLCYALSNMGRRQGNSATLREAITSCHLSLEEKPYGWALLNLGHALLALGEQESDKSRLDEAAATFQSALQS